MKGLVIWAQSFCRSTMGVYRELANEYDVPVIIVTRGCSENDLRFRVGFKRDEFKDVAITEIGEKYEDGVALLNRFPGFNHLFGGYQNNPIYRRLIMEAKRRGAHVGVFSESPCVMTDGIKGWVKKNIYLPFYVKHIVKPIVDASDFIVNLSGDSTAALRNIGWREEQIVPFGYFPPPILGSRIVRRRRDKEFHVLVTGIMTWHRSPETIIKALTLLKKWGVPFKATFTQDGPMKSLLRRMVMASGLPVDFPGFVPLDKLIGLYETCSVYVAAGRREPWGMRLNDALQCGAPLLVSRGMGGVQLVDDYGCGMAFEADDYVDLACKLRRLIENDEDYARVVENAEVAARQISPLQKAKALKAMWKCRFPEWL